MADTDTEPSHPPGMLLVADVAELWTSERRARRDAQLRRRYGTADPAKIPAALTEPKQITTATVLTYLRRFRNTDTPVPEPRGRLGSHRRLPWWSTEQADELREWYRRRPGHGHGRGGWPAGTPRSGYTPDPRPGR